MSSITRRNIYKLMPTVLVTGGVASAAAVLLLVDLPPHSNESPSDKTWASISRSSSSSPKAPSSSVAAHLELLNSRPDAPVVWVEISSTRNIANPTSAEVDTVRALLDSDHENDVVASALVNLIPALSRGRQIEVAHQISSLLDDSHYQLAADLLINPSTVPHVSEALFEDLVDRDPVLQLPLLVEILSIPNHPMRFEARKKLAEYFEHDYGSDASEWLAALSHLGTRWEIKELQ